MFFGQRKAKQYIERRVQRQLVACDAANDGLDVALIEVAEATMEEFKHARALARVHHRGRDEKPSRDVV